MANTAGQQAGLMALGALTGMPVGAGAMPQSFQLAFDDSTRSSANGAAYGGGGFDGSGWVVNVMSPGQGYVPPVKVGSVADNFALPNNVTAPIGAQVHASASPGLMLAAGAVLFLILKGKRK